MQSPIKRIVNLLILPALTGIILGISANPSRLWFLGFVAFIPLLIAAENILKAKRTLLLFSFQLFIAQVIFYSWVYLWVLKTANLGFLIGFLIVLPYIVLVAPYILLRQSWSKIAVLYFISAWLSAEYIQSFYQIGSPFFNLGNNPAASPQLIQWYEYTGSGGGSLWILAVNCAIFKTGTAFQNDSKQWISKSITTLAVLILPMIISLLIFRSYEDKGSPSRVLIIHPSTDNRDVKYRVNIYELMDIYLGIMMPQLENDIEYVVLPETAITNAGWISDLNNNLVFDRFHERTVSFPDLKLVTGAIVYEAIPDVEKIKDYNKIPGIRFSKNYNTWYYTYNSALQIEKGRPVQIRTKEGLVPYQEYAPYPRLLPRLSHVGIDFQFSIRKKNQQVFTSGNRRKTASLICYELVYGSKFFKAAREGAEAFFVLLNEGWYLNYPKVRSQFLQLSVVRAVENRRGIAHSSNMGISAFIDQRGNVLSTRCNLDPGFLKSEITMNKRITLYTAIGNYLEKLSLSVIILSIFATLIRKFLKSNQSG